MYDKSFKTHKKIKTIQKIGMIKDWQERCSKMVVLPKAMHRFTTIPIKIPIQFFTYLEKIRLQFQKTHKETTATNKIAETILNYERINVCFTITNFKLSYKIMGIKESSIGIRIDTLVSRIILKLYT